MKTKKNNSINSLTNNVKSSYKNLITVYSLSLLILFFISMLSLINKKNNDDTMVLSLSNYNNNSIAQIKQIKDFKIDLSQIIKEKDGIYTNLLPGTYKAELIDKSKSGCIEIYNSTTLNKENMINNYTLNENSYFIIDENSLLVKLEGVKITLQQDFYLFGL